MAGSGISQSGIDGRYCTNIDISLVFFERFDIVRLFLAYLIFKGFQSEICKSYFCWIAQLQNCLAF